MALTARKMACAVTLLTGCSRAQVVKEAAPAVRVPLSAQGLPNGFFKPDDDTKCAGQIIGYRFVVWLNNEDVAVGFNTSPSCRQAAGRKVEGMARVLLFDRTGALKAKRDIPYLADGNGEIVAAGEAMAGPGGTLLFRIQSVNLDQAGSHESKSGLLLLDAELKDVARVDQFLEQTTFVDHALVFQEGFTLQGPRTYSVLSGTPPRKTGQWQQDWPTGTMDRRFGDHGLAYMLCRQELRPGVYSSSNVIYANAKRRCVMTSEAEDHSTWEAPLEEEGTAAIVGLLADGSVVGQLHSRDAASGKLVLWKKAEPPEVLPWIPKNYDGAIQSATATMSRYAAFAVAQSKGCGFLESLCGRDGEWFVFDRASAKPIAAHPLAGNARAALSPDGQRYATFEAGELRIYSLPQSAASR